MRSHQLFFTAALLLATILCGCTGQSAATGVSPTVTETIPFAETVVWETSPTETAPVPTEPAETEPVSTEFVQQVQETTAPAEDLATVLPDYAPDAYALELLEAVNAARTANGLPPLVLDETLCRLAYVRAQEAAVQWSHTRPNGQPCYSVYEDYAIPRVFWTGENLANYALQDAQLIADSWMESEDHRKNILYPKYTAAGMAVFWSGENYYIANLFRS